MDKSSQTQDFELLTEIAIAYYCDEVTQEEIANRFGFSRIKIGRLLKRAKEEGIVEINVRYHPVFSTQLEKQMQERFPISRALIALDHNDEDEQRRQWQRWFLIISPIICVTIWSSRSGRGVMWRQSLNTSAQSRQKIVILFAVLAVRIVWRCHQRRPYQPSSGEEIWRQQRIALCARLR